MKIRLLAGLTALAAGALMIGFAPAAQAATGSVPIPDGVVSTNAPCWTSFSPQDPQGAGMVEYYHNCGSSTAYYICPLYVGGSTLYNGTNVSYCNEQQTVPSGDTAIWVFSSTYSTGHYTTVSDFAIDLNLDGQSITEDIPGDGPLCWTTLYPDSGPPGSLFITYNNCTAATVSVCLFYIGGSTLLNGTNLIDCAPAATLPSDYNVGWTVDPEFTTGQYSVSFNS
jgi:hypothetical protein